MGLIHSSCSKFLQDRCNIVLQSEETNSVVDSVEGAIHTLVNQGSDSDTVRWCGEVFLAIVCNSMYLGCEPTTTLPIGLCETTCLEYTTRNSCLPFFAEVNKALNETGETGDLDAYTDCSANHSFLKGANESTNTCYQGVCIYVSLRVNSLGTALSCLRLKSMNHLSKITSDTPPCPSMVSHLSLFSSPTHLT